MTNPLRCGYVALVGRPNVGKSTLLNRLLGKKISITSSKPQTTRHRILGIKTRKEVQVIYVDTPGIHQQLKRALNRVMVRSAYAAMEGVDVVVFVIDVRHWTEEDEIVFERIRTLSCPIVLALNKIDMLSSRDDLLPMLEHFHRKLPRADIVPISAFKGENLNALEQVITQFLPVRPHEFREEQITDRDDVFLAAERVREKIMRMTEQEVPYETSVTVETFKKQKNILYVDVVIWVEREGQRMIMIGKKGERLKEIGQQARLELEKIFHCKIFLTLWVKVKTGWSDNEDILHRLGMG